jgi:hypothetical protein
MRTKSVTPPLARTWTPGNRDPRAAPSASSHGAYGFTRDSLFSGGYTHFSAILNIVNIYISIRSRRIARDASAVTQKSPS